jgi:RNA polymerase sigma-70 factor, ECF subfamily
MNAPEGDPVLDLIDRAAQGDQAARAELIEKHYPTLLRKADSLLPRDQRAPASANDVVQEALLKFLQHLKDAPDAGKEDPRQYLEAIVRNTVVDTQRRLPPQKHLPLQAQDSTSPGVDPEAREPTPAEVLAERDRKARVQLALDDLDEDDRRLIELRQEGLTHGQIAARLGLSAAAVKKRHQRVIARLCGMLEGVL